MSDLGLVALDSNGVWLGGRYYLQHLVKAVAQLPQAERIPICDVWWQTAPPEDPFAEVRELLSRKAVVSLPRSAIGRARRAARRLVRGVTDARDLFERAGIGAIFPTLPCNAPGVPYLFWLSDFQYVHYPELFGEERCAWYRRYFEDNTRLADVVVLSSADALDDFKRELPQWSHKGRVVHFCSLPDAAWHSADPEDTARLHGLLGKFFLVSNQFSHHKNHGVVFEAVRILRSRGLSVRVACTGSTYGFRGSDYFDGLEAFRREHGLEDQVRVLGMLPRAEQVALMRRSIAMLQPSRFEGWSTVVEDARTLGKPLVASAIGVHREQLGESHPALVDPGDAESWADLMGRWWRDLDCGPDLSAERIGLAGTVDRAREYGRAFVGAVREAGLR